jgi:TRAP-type C4-dicarboxylate transport system substrate-binding protein
LRENTDGKSGEENQVPGNAKEESMRRRSVLLACALALSVSASSAVAQDKQFNLKLSYWVPPSHLLTPGYKEWAASVEKASNGTITNFNSYTGTFTYVPNEGFQGLGGDTYGVINRGERG